MRYVLHCISVIGSFMFLYGLLYLILRYTVGRIPIIRNTTIYGLPLEVPLFGIVVIWFILTYVKISSPWLKGR